MPDPVPFTLVSRPGIHRDGTRLDSMGYVDGQWVRFQRERPRKMGGYRELSTDVSGPARGMYVWARQDYTALVIGSQFGIEQLLIDSGGIGSSLSDRTPSGFTADDKLQWSFDAIYNDAVGADEAIIVAHPGRYLAALDDPTAKPVYIGDAAGTGAFTAIAGVTVSGGIVAINPYLVVFGTDGYVAWSNANEPENFTTGDTGADRVTAFKIVRGLPIRSGQGPAALLWSLDSVIKMQWAGGTDIFRFDTLTTQSSILSAQSVIEYDGVFYWVGVDRFLMYDGAIRELANDFNLNWFFDGLNQDQHAKVWAMKVPRFGEVIWFYPRGTATECTHAVVYNVREKVWYDFELSRTSGYPAKIFRRPIMSGEISEPATASLTLTPTTGIFQLNEVVVGGTSNARGRVRRYITIPATRISVGDITVAAFQAAEVVTGQTSGATGTISGAPVIQDLYDVWVHEFGYDRVTDETAVSIDSWYETHELGFPTGNPAAESPQGVNQWSRLPRIELDFLQQGEMTLEIIGKGYPNSADQSSEVFVFNPATEVIEPRVQFREYRLRFRSDTLGGSYQQGRILLHVGPGDRRV